MAEGHLNERAEKILQEIASSETIKAASAGERTRAILERDAAVRLICEAIDELARKLENVDDQLEESVDGIRVRLEALEGRRADVDGKIQTLARGGHEAVTNANAAGARARRLEREHGKRLDDLQKMIEALGKDRQLVYHLQERVDQVVAKAEDVGQGNERLGYTLRNLEAQLEGLDQKAEQRAVDLEVRIERNRRIADGANRDLASLEGRLGDLEHSTDTLRRQTANVARFRDEVDEAVRTIRERKAAREPRGESLVLTPVDAHRFRTLLSRLEACELDSLSRELAKLLRADLEKADAAPIETAAKSEGPPGPPVRLPRNEHVAPGAPVPTALVYLRGEPGFEVPLTDEGRRRIGYAGPFTREGWSAWATRGGRAEKPTILRPGSKVDRRPLELRGFRHVRPGLVGAILAEPGVELDEDGGKIDPEDDVDGCPPRVCANCNEADICDREQRAEGTCPDWELRPGCSETELHLLGGVRRLRVFCPRWRDLGIDVELIDSRDWDASRETFHLDGLEASRKRGTGRHRSPDSEVDLELGEDDGVPSWEEIEATAPAGYRAVSVNYQRVACAGVVRDLQAERKAEIRDPRTPQGGVDDEDRERPRLGQSWRETARRFAAEAELDSSGEVQRICATCGASLRCPAARSGIDRIDRAGCPFWYSMLPPSGRPESTGRRHVDVERQLAGLAPLAAPGDPGWVSPWLRRWITEDDPPAESDAGVSVNPRGCGSATSSRGGPTKPHETPHETGSDTPEAAQEPKTAGMAAGLVASADVERVACARTVEAIRAATVARAGAELEAEDEPDEFPQCVACEHFADRNDTCSGELLDAAERAVCPVWERRPPTVAGVAAGAELPVGVDREAARRELCSTCGAEECCGIGDEATACPAWRPAGSEDPPGCATCAVDVDSCSPAPRPDGGASCPDFRRFEAGPAQKLEPESEGVSAPAGSDILRVTVDGESVEIPGTLHVYPNAEAARLHTAALTPDSGSHSLDGTQPAAARAAEACERAGLPGLARYAEAAAERAGVDLVDLIPTADYVAAVAAAQAGDTAPAVEIAERLRLRGDTENEARWRRFAEDPEAEVARETAELAGVEREARAAVGERWPTGTEAVEALIGAAAAGGIPEVERELDRQLGEASRVRPEEFRPVAAASMREASDLGVERGLAKMIRAVWAGRREATLREERDGYRPVRRFTVEIPWRVEDEIAEAVATAGADFVAAMREALGEIAHLRPQDRPESPRSGTPDREDLESAREARREELARAFPRTAAVIAANEAREKVDREISDEAPENPPGAPRDETPGRSVADELP